jgi:hypothetical protein
MKTFNATDKELWDILIQGINYIAYSKYQAMYQGFFNEPFIDSPDDPAAIWVTKDDSDCGIDIPLNINYVDDWKKSLTRRPE